MDLTRRNALALLILAGSVALAACTPVVVALTPTPRRAPAPTGQEGKPDNQVK
ncbi:hypothetical protein [Arenibaculum pallidiluteum]|uniref:hypothetical protein n=1 Tax=Arenibaculum pallidiluteum TaxID=2812559 RepID=UPI001A962758|nr:hypothetical protein [Arenibaculum pallidiluteum]